MSALTAAKAGTVERTPDDLAGRLHWLCRFGKPKVGKYGATGGWHASIEMNTNTTGASFDVGSEFNHATPDQAVATLIERMLCALKAAGGDA